MNPETLKASVTYQDYVGTVAADHHDTRSLSDLAESHGIDSKRYFIVGVQVWAGETRNDEYAQPRISLLTVDMNQTRAGSIDFIRKFAVDNGNTLPFQRFTIELSFSELLDYFKRFDLVLFNRQLESIEVFDETEAS